MTEEMILKDIWTEEEIQLIAEVKQHPPIYENDSVTKYGLEEYNASWDEVSNRLGKPAFMCKTTWQKIEKTYADEMEKCKSSELVTLSKYLDGTLDFLKSRILSSLKYDLRTNLNHNQVDSGTHFKAELVTQEYVDDFKDQTSSQLYMTNEISKMDTVKPVFVTDSVIKFAPKVDVLKPSHSSDSISSNSSEIVFKKPTKIPSNETVTLTNYHTKNLNPVKSEVDTDIQFICRDAKNKKPSCSSGIDGRSKNINNSQIKTTILPYKFKESYRKYKNPEFIDSTKVLGDIRKVKSRSKNIRRTKKDAETLCKFEESSDSFRSGVSVGDKPHPVAVNTIQENQKIQTLDQDYFIRMLNQGIAESRNIKQSQNNKNQNVKCNFIKEVITDKIDNKSVVENTVQNLINSQITKIITNAVMSNSNNEKVLLSNSVSGMPSHSTDMIHKTKLRDVNKLKRKKHTESVFYVEHDDKNDFLNQNHINNTVISFEDRYLNTFTDIDWNTKKIVDESNSNQNILIDDYVCKINNVESVKKKRGKVEEVGNSKIKSNNNTNAESNTAETSVYFTGPKSQECLQQLMSSSATSNMTSGNFTGQKSQECLQRLMRSTDARTMNVAENIKPNHVVSNSIIDHVSQTRTEETVDKIPNSNNVSQDYFATQDLVNSLLINKGVDPIGNFDMPPLVCIAKNVDKDTVSIKPYIIVDFDNAKSMIPSNNLVNIGTSSSNTSTNTANSVQDIGLTTQHRKDKENNISEDHVKKRSCILDVKTDDTDTNVFFDQLADYVSCTYPLQKQNDICKKICALVTDHDNTINDFTFDAESELLQHNIERINRRNCVLERK